MEKITVFKTEGGSYNIYVSEHLIGSADIFLVIKTCKIVYAAMWLALRASEFDFYGVDQRTIDEILSFTKELNKTNRRDAVVYVKYEEPGHVAIEISRKD